MHHKSTTYSEPVIKEVEAIAKEKDFQVWVERVADTKSGNSIYIEEGEIK